MQDERKGLTIEWRRLTSAECLERWAPANTNLPDRPWVLGEYWPFDLRAADLPAGTLLSVKMQD